MASIQVVSVDDPRMTAPLKHVWQDEALCAQIGPAVFFPDKGGSTIDAKMICSGCDVQLKCLEYALRNDERFGIFGGLTERERRRATEILKNDSSMTVEAVHKVITSTRSSRGVKRSKLAASQELQAL